jgi:hypothetical protein
VRHSEMKQTIGRSFSVPTLWHGRARSGGIGRWHWESLSHPVSVENVEAFEVLLLRGVPVDSFGGGQMRVLCCNGD